MSIPYRIATLVFIKNKEGKHLLLQRNKSPNKGCWSPIGGKLKMEEGESPFECAIRETFEETGHEIQKEDLHLFGMVTEKSYEGTGHWLLFLFNCLKPVATLPKSFDEGQFGFFERDALDTLAIPATDRKGLWPLYDEFSNSFSILRVDCALDYGMEIIVEESLSSNLLNV